METRKNKLTTKYRSVEHFAGSPASTIPSIKANRKVNPARAKRSNLRMEMFTKRKLEEKKTKEEVILELSLAEKTEEIVGLATGDTGGNANRLVLDLSKDVQPKSDETGVTSPILQLDGDGDESENKLTYTFSSDYAEEDILETLKEFFPDESLVMSSITSRVRTRRLSA